jgi:hypothetical protein
MRSGPRTRESFGRCQQPLTGSLSQSVVERVMVSVRLTIMRLLGCLLLNQPQTICVSAGNDLWVVHRSTESTEVNAGRAQ